jgi:alanyl-tRNA synthetase
MTEKLYYQDPDLLDFEARLLRLEQDEERWRAVLDRTAFYPEGGGHPPDQGTLNEIPVLDVQEIDGEVVHFVAGPLQGSEGPGSKTPPRYLPIWGRST